MRTMICPIDPGPCLNIMLKMIGVIDMTWLDRSLPFISAVIAVKGFMPLCAENSEERGVDYF